MNRKLKFNIPFYDESELSAVKDYMENGTDYKTKAAQHIKARTNADGVLLASGATSAMDAFFAGADLPKGSEVIMPSYTFPAAANAVLRAGLKPVFADINSNTLVMDCSNAVEKLTSSTSCIMPVHYGGASVDLDKLSKICFDKKLFLFEDAALSYGGKYKDRHLGTIGDAGVISFHNTKNISGDGGGALLVNGTRDIDIYKMLMANGTDKPAFLRGDVPEYTWQIKGAGAEMSGLTASVLWAQLNKDKEIYDSRKKIWDTYYKTFKEARIEKYAALPVIPEFNKNNYHVFYLNFITNDIREKTRKKLLEQGIQAVIHYMPLHASRMGQKLGYRANDLPVTNRVSECILRLPIHMAMTANDTEYICDKVKSAVLNV